MYSMKCDIQDKKHTTKHDGRYREPQRYRTKANERRTWTRIDLIGVA